MAFDGQLVILSDYFLQYRETRWAQVETQAGMSTRNTAGPQLG
jgi:hypothetical protein